MWLRFTSGANDGQSQEIKAYDGDNKTFDFCAAFPNFPVGGDEPDEFTIEARDRFDGKPSLSAVDDFYTGLILRFTSGPNEGQAR